MTKEDIKQSVSMREVIERYGVSINRNGFCRCPFHDERTASFRVYKDSFFCFGCGKSGDVFTFVQNVENCDFKTAFEILGGTYDQDHKMANMRRYRSEKGKETKQAKLDKLDKKIRLKRDELQVCMMIDRKTDPFSDVWCYCVNKIPYLRSELENLEKEWEEINNGSSIRV